MLELDLTAARAAIVPFAIRTPLVRAPDLDEHAGGDVYLKLENLQATGSFKVRGAASRMAALTAEERARGVVTCSSGNHGRAVAYVARRMGLSATICVPSWVDLVKLSAIEEAGAEAVVFGDTYDEAEAEAFRRERDLGLVFVHPFDDPLIAAGQGTIAAEILEDLPNTGTVIIPLSGGGLVGGIAYGLATIDGSVDAIAVSARNARVMFESLRVGRSLEMEEEETLASALSGGIGPDNRYTMALVAEHVREHLLVSEAEIAGAMRFAAERLKLVVEGGGAVGIAALLAGKLPIGGRSAGGTASRPLVIVVSGGNVALETLAGL